MLREAFARSRLTLVGLIFAGIGLTAFATFWLNRPTTVTFLVGPSGSDGAKAVVALQQALAREKSSVRIRTVVADSPVDSQVKLDREEVDFAIVRADFTLPANAQAVAVWQRNPVILVAPLGENIERWTDLTGKTVGVLGRGIGFNMRLIELLLREQGVQPARVKLVEIAPWEAGEALKRHLINAMITIGPATSRPVADAVAGMVREAALNQVAFVPIKEAEAIADRVAYLESFDVLTGSFGSNPPLPAQTYPSVSVSHYLMARRSLPDSVVGEFTQQLFALRPSLAVQHPVLQRVEVPDTEKGSSVQVHPGALAYLTGEQQTFLEKYSDVIYIGIFGISIVGSGFAALAGVFGWGKKEPTPSPLPDVIDLLRVARATDDPAVLDAVAQAADDIFVITIDRVRARDLDEAQFSTLTLALEHLNTAIADRRRSLAMRDEEYSQASIDAPMAPRASPAVARG
ncbi:MAG: TAXI family TRAP transporter solute-binding subunit [Alphaproteobacteria bacterium]|jgi:TRAP transporter TAXI family solute receptor